jgi:CyaY protein
MSDSKLLDQIDATLVALVETLDALDHDAFDVDSADGKVTLEFDDDSVLIVNRQAAVAQIWLAEPAGGWHYSWDGSAWLCDRRGVELLESLEELISAKVGERIVLR